MASTYKIAVIQLHPKPMQIDGNYAKAIQFIRNAADQGAQLAVLPEYHLTNWVPADPRTNDIYGQWEIYLKKYCALAKELGICIVPGTIIERHEDPETKKQKLLNVAYFIGDKGEILGRYQKKNLWHPERPYLTSSTHEPHEVINTPIGPVGLLICWDLAFPEAFRELILAGAKIIIIPTFWTLSDCSQYGLATNPRSEALFLESTITARAYENTCAVVFVNAGGPVGSSRSTYAGLSRVAVPFLGALGDETKDSSEEGMSIVDLDMRHVEEAEANYKVRADLARDDWHYSSSKKQKTGRMKL
ncbi:MAG: hypothetical protein Q9169_006896 [Polycauliona sp. 2 TL-2023]